MVERTIFVKLGCDGSYAVLNLEVAQVLLFLDSVQLRSKQAAMEKLHRKGNAPVEEALGSLLARARGRRDFGSRPRRPYLCGYRLSLQRSKTARMNFSWPVKWIASGGAG